MMIKAISFKRFNNFPSIILLNIGIVTAFYLGLYYLNIVGFLPNEHNLLHWDAVFYHEIKTIGYIHLPNQPSNMAFFPFFSWIWKLTGLSTVGITIFNAVLFSFSLWALMSKSKFNPAYILALLSLPCLIFFYLPYTESLFFLFGTCLIIGFKKDSKWMIIIGIFGCCLTRAVSTVFIPILITTEFLYCRTFPKLNPRLILYCLSASFAILITVLAQGLQTGKWFYYLEAAKDFNRNLTFPSLPFTTIAPEKILGTDGLAWFIGSLAMYFCIKWAINLSFNFFKQEVDKQSILLLDRSVYFSILFVAAIFLIDTVFTNKMDGHTNLWSINRHLLCTPFAFNFLSWMYKDFKASKFDLYAFGVLLILGFFVTGVFQYTIHIYFYLLASFAFVFSRFIKRGYLIFYPLYIFNIMLLTVYYQDYLSLRWVG